MEEQTSPPPQTLAEPVKPQCKYCKAQVAENFYFCPSCGKKIKEPPFKFSWGKTIVVLLESVFIPPFGIIPGIRYLLKKDNRAIIVGLTAIILTFLSTGITIIYTINFINKTASTYNYMGQTQNAINNPSGSVQDQIEQLQKSGH